MALTHEFVGNRLKEVFGEKVLSVEQVRDFLTIEVQPEAILEILTFLRNNPDMSFIYLTDICGVHNPDQKGREIAAVYHLHNLIENCRIRVKAWMPAEHPELESATGLWAGANWMERETYDFFGIQFKGHPNLKRILNVDHMEIFPLRKEFPLEDTVREDKDDRFFGR